MSKLEQLAALRAQKFERMRKRPSAQEVKDIADRAEARSKSSNGGGESRPARAWSPRAGSRVAPKTESAHGAGGPESRSPTANRLTREESARPEVGVAPDPLEVIPPSTRKPKMPRAAKKATKPVHKKGVWAPKGDYQRLYMARRRATTPETKAAAEKAFKTAFPNRRTRTVAKKKKAKR